MLKVFSSAVVLAMAALLAGCDPLEGDFLVVANDCEVDIVVEFPGSTGSDGVVVKPGRAWSTIAYAIPSEPILVSTADRGFSQEVDTNLWTEEARELALDVPPAFCAKEQIPLVATPMSSTEIDERYHGRID